MGRRESFSISKRCLGRSPARGWGWREELGPVSLPPPGLLPELIRVCRSPAGPIWVRKVFAGQRGDRSSPL